MYVPLKRRQWYDGLFAAIIMLNYHLVLELILLSLGT